MLRIHDWQRNHNAILIHLEQYMNLQSTIQVGALFKLIVHKGNPKKPTKETQMFHNLVLDSGLNRLSAGSAIGVVCVGSGNSTPNKSQTQLDSFVASTTTEQGGVTSIQQAVTEPYYYGARRSYRFAEGVAAGNLSEVGIGWGQQNLFNRALIKDVNGNPVTITVLSDEYLDVIVELRVYPQREISGSFNLLDKLGSVVSTHTVVGTCLIAKGGAFTLGPITIGDSTYRASHVYSGDIQSEITAFPVNFLARSSEVINSYPTPRSCKGIIKYQLSEGVGVHRSFVAGPNNLLANTPYETEIGYKWQIDPPIAKTNMQEIQYTVTLSWDRYEPA